MVFQPIVELDTREVVGYEALSRFSVEPQRGPDEWFAEAHEVGLGSELELQAVRLACEQSDALPEGTFMALNVSPVTTERPSCSRCSECCQVDHIVLEVTEHHGWTTTVASGWRSPACARWARSSRSTTPAPASRACATSWSSTRRSSSSTAR